MLSITLLDNFDSFTWNLVDQFRSNQHHVTVYRNDIDANNLAEKLLNQSEKSILVLSPGPGTPAEAGCMMRLIEKVAGKLPILGICLGHQALIEHYGGKVDLAEQIMHGKASLMQHDHSSLFTDLPNPLSVARYHSLVGVAIPTSLQVVAHVNNVPMAIMHVKDRAIGYQFHPESILTEQGAALISNTLEFLSKGSSLC